MRWSRFLLALLCVSTVTLSSADDPLLRGFQDPPATAKPQTWWHWINGNISQAGITADLEAMKKIGLGGAEIFNVDVGIPAGKTPFMSPQWNAAIAHAISEGKRLGLEICVHNCAGWSSSGGPWITPANAMQFLTWSETPVHGPSHFEDKLPQPKTKENYYRDIAVYAIRKPGDDAYRIKDIRTKAGYDRGDRILPDDTKIAAADIIARDDVHLLPMAADGSVSWDVPDGDWILIRMGYTPTGEGNHPAPASGYGLEVDKLSRSALDTHWDGMVASVLKDAGAASNPGLDDVLIDSYEVGSQNWTPKFREEFRARRGYDPLPYLPVVTGRVIGSLEQSERFLWDFRRTICDLFSDNYYGYFAQLCHEHGLKFSDEGYGNGSFDNLEVCGDADIPMGEFWVGGSAVETTKLAASAGHIYGKPVIGAESFTADTPHGRWLYDPYSLKVLGDRVFCLGINRYIFHRYAHQPWLDVVPGMTMGPWGTHLDRTMTWWDQGAAWMKYIARCQYLLQSGRFVADVAAYEGEEGPNDMPMLGGTTVPAGYDYDGLDVASLMKMKVQNGLLVLPSGMRYRVLLLPNDTWMSLKVANKISELVHAGATVVGPKPMHSPSLAEYGSGDAMVARIGNTLWGNADGKTVKFHRFGSGLVFPNIPLSEVLSTLRLGPDCSQVRGWDLNWIHRKDGPKDVYFVANPKYVPGTFELSFRTTGREPEIWNPVTGVARPADIWFTKNGRTTVDLRLESAGSVFVIFRNPAKGDHLVALSHGTTARPKPIAPKIEIVSARYEANDGAGGTDVTAKVRAMVAHGQTTLEANNGNFGDPTYDHVKHLSVTYRLNGKERTARAEENEALDLTGEKAGSDMAKPDYTIADGVLYAWTPGRYSAETARGRLIAVDAPAPKTMTIAGAWKLSFPPNLGAPPSVTLDKLASWTDSSEFGVKYFSGTATYEKSFDVPASMLAAGHKAYLDLGLVKNFAEVWLNGKHLPILWKEPFRISADGLHAGTNTLVVKVTNLWPNRLIGDEQYPVEGDWNADGSIAKMPDWALNMEPRPKSDRITFATWRFFTKDSPLLESGLIGPVSVVSVPAIKLITP
ncbi:MAG TPA: glycosyl hydrolase [Fimbriimonadaceae bacterium]|nr:glycosyl hydrolase [Fimbriimonadaceae bacterium]